MLLFISGLMTREIGFVNVKTISGNRKNNELFNWVGVELTNVTIPATQYILTYIHTYLAAAAAEIIRLFHTLMVLIITQFQGNFKGHI